MGRKGEGDGEEKDAHSAQFGDSAIVAVICLFSAFNVGFADVSRRMTSWRLLGARVNIIGRDIFAMSSLRGWVQ
jgi:hypothetical protein